MHLELYNKIFKNLLTEGERHMMLQWCDLEFKFKGLISNRIVRWILHYVKMSEAFKRNNIQQHSLCSAFIIPIKVQCFTKYRSNISTQNDSFLL